MYPGARAACAVSRPAPLVRPGQRPCRQEHAEGNPCGKTSRRSGKLTPKFQHKCEPPAWGIGHGRYFLNYRRTARFWSFIRRGGAHKKTVKVAQPVHRLRLEGNASVAGALLYFLQLLNFPGLYFPVSFSRTTSDSSSPRSMARREPSCEKTKRRMRSAVKCVSGLLAEPSSGCAHKLSTPLLRTT